MRKVYVAGAVVGKASVTLFLTDGAQEVLQQENFRTQEILEKVMPQLVVPDATVEIDLDNYSIAKHLENATNGAIQVKEDLAGNVSLTHGKTVIADAKPLMQHIDRSKLDGAKGFQAFLGKFGEIKRPYTQKELLKFLEGADLPLMEDGSILGFKILVDGANGVMVDPHTRKVTQRLGSLVYMPESKVDQSRALCSTGLHIAARRYLSGFWSGGRRLCLVKIQPKDVVSVPIGETSKMRVSAYHIVKVFSAEDGERIKNGTAIHDIPSALKLLEEAVAGDHGPITERVEVTGYGEVKVTPVETKIQRIVRKVRKVSRVSRTDGKGQAVPPSLVNALKKLIRGKKELKDRDPKYLSRLARAQNWFDKGKSIRWISEKMDMDRDSLSANLNKGKQRKAA